MNGLPLSYFSAEQAAAEARVVNQGRKRRMRAELATYAEEQILAAMFSAENGWINTAIMHLMVADRLVQLVGGQRTFTDLAVIAEQTKALERLLNLPEGAAHTVTAEALGTALEPVANRMHEVMA